MRLAARHKRLCIAFGDVLLLLLLAWLLWPVSQREASKVQVDMLVETCYEVSADGRFVFSFADINDSAEFTSGAVNADSTVTRKMEAPGFFVNRVPFMPSCFGSIITYSPPGPKDVVSWDNGQLHRALFRQSIISEQRLVGLQRMRNELHYYKRKHSVTDYGYNQIAAFSTIIDKRVDSLQAIVDTLQSIKPNAKLTIRYVTRYTVLRATTSGKTIDRACSEVKTYDGKFSLVRIHGNKTAMSAATRLSITGGKEQLLAAKPNTRQDTVKAAAVREDSTVTVSDSTGVYVGTVDKEKRYIGLGRKYYYDGAYYEGFWAEGVPDGFGFMVSPHYYMQAGTWKAGVFKGEKLTYNANRVYGIDISRHQHEKNGAVFSIDWDKIRITNLGTATDKKIEGKVDYPVSFIYIKSTEGCTVTNSYFAADYAMARKKGIRVGAYHFFSTTSSGKSQAQEFLKKTKFSKGDLAPVLDVEPTEAQVTRMGGVRALQSSIRQWINTVYSELKMYPIIYIGQKQANQYLRDAPDITAECVLWVARYGEYQPNLRLAIWQLSSDGRVSGIHGDVDINVFSGYETQFQDFVSNHTFK